MQKRDIQKRLRVLKTPDDKLNYLRKIWEGNQFHRGNGPRREKGLVKGETMIAIEESMGDAEYQKQEYGSAADAYRRAGELYEKEGNFKNAKQFYKKAAETYVTAGYYREAGDAMEKAGDNYQASVYHKLHADGKSVDPWNSADRRGVIDSLGRAVPSRRRKGKKGDLEAAASSGAATAAIIGLLGGIFFFSSNLTGNAIGLNQSTGNIFGAILLVIGLVGSFFWFRNKNK